MLGNIESGIEFEKIMSIYQNCRSPNDIKADFDKIQEELENQIKEKILQTRQTLFENFDDDVSNRLKVYHDKAQQNLSQYEKWLLSLLKSKLGDEFIEDEEITRFYYNGNWVQKEYYNTNWKSTDKNNDKFLRIDSELVRSIIDSSLESNITEGFIKFNYSRINSKISFLENLKVSSGYLNIDKLISKFFAN